MPERNAVAPHRQNQALIETLLPAMNCPSDQKAAYVEFKPIREATGSYAFCTGTKGPSYGTTNGSKYRRAGADGAFLYIQGDERHGLKLKQITDGLSHTYFFGETRDGHLSETRNRWTAAGRFVDSLRSTENPLATPPGVGGEEFSGDGYVTTGCFASRHPGGAQFAYGDGRVEFVSENIADGLYKAASTRAGADDFGEGYQSQLQ